MKKLFLVLFTFLIPAVTLNAQFYIINTVAGDTAGYSGDGGPATAAEMNQPWGVAADNSGNIYIADYKNQCVRMVNSAGIISTFAGNSVYGFSGDGGQASAAELKYPTGVATDAANNIYIADAFNNRVRKVNTSGVISTIAGNGAYGFGGDGGPATNASFRNPVALAVDGAGNVYVCDFYNFRIRKVNTGGIISSIAGNGSFGYSGDGGPATSAQLYDVVGVAVDPAGNIYIGDEGNARVRMVNTSGIISTFAGNGTQGYSGDGGPATDAEMNHPYGVMTDATGDLFITDYSNSVIRKVDPSGTITTIAGSTGGFSGDGGQATAAQIFIPTSLSMNSSGDIFICDNGNNRIRQLTYIAGFNELTRQHFTIYPNPSAGVFSISGEDASVVKTLKIYNLNGKEIYTSAFNTTAYINIAPEPEGIYMYRILTRTGAFVASGRLVIVK